MEVLVQCSIWQWSGKKAAWSLSSVFHCHEACWWDRAGVTELVGQSWWDRAGGTELVKQCWAGLDTATHGVTGEIGFVKLVKMKPEKKNWGINPILS